MRVFSGDIPIAGLGLVDHGPEVRLQVRHRLDGTHKLVDRTAQERRQPEDFNGLGRANSFLRLIDVITPDSSNLLLKITRFGRIIMNDPSTRHRGGFTNDWDRYMSRSSRNQWWHPVRGLLGYMESVVFERNGPSSARSVSHGNSVRER